jgi:hypothetical protein
MRRRFFYHYRKCDGQMSVHFKGRCIPCKNVECAVACETKRNKRQPYLVMQGWATGISKLGDTVRIW